MSAQTVQAAKIVVSSSDLDAFGRDVVTTGQGGSIPLATALAELLPETEILLVGVEEPGCRIHGPNESVDPDELRRTALAQALFLADLGGLLEGDGR